MSQQNGNSQQWQQAQQASGQHGQNPQEIANPQSPSLPKVKGPDMNDRDRINDILSMEKYLIQSTNVAAWEASHQQLHQEYMQIVNECHACHREIFNLMFQNGWYKLEAEQQQKLDQAQQQFSGYATQFPYNPAAVQ